MRRLSGAFVLLALWSLCSLCFLGCVCPCPGAPAKCCCVTKAKLPCCKDKCDCGCAEGKDCTCAEFKKLRTEALALITAPPAAGGIPAKLPEALRLEVEKTCVDLGLWTTSERWSNWDVANEHYNGTQSNINWARHAYQNLHGEAHLYPGIGEAARLPKHEFATANVATFTEAIFWSYNHCGDGYDPEAVYNMRVGLNDAELFWRLVAACTDTSRHEMLRRRDLYQLRGWVGDRIWVTGNWTAFPPLSSVTSR